MNKSFLGWATFINILHTVRLHGQHSVSTTIMQYNNSRRQKHWSDTNVGEYEFHCRSFTSNLWNLFSVKYFFISAHSNIVLKPGFHVLHVSHHHHAIIFLNRLLFQQWASFPLDAQAETDKTVIGTRKFTTYREYSSQIRLCYADTDDGNRDRNTGYNNTTRVKDAEA